jgi:hypothetical protein
VPDHFTDFRGGHEILEKHLSSIGLVDVLALSRTVTSTNVTVELVPGGDSLVAIESSKASWLEALLRSKLVTSIEQ